MRKLFIQLAAVLISISLQAQKLQRPKLVVGIVVDQMRWDFLYRYFDRYSPTGGFKRMMNNGFSCENTFIHYTPTVTACGHAGIYTGSVPAVHGITGNFWWDNKLNRSVYCTEDSSVKTVGSNTTAGLQSPKNLFTTTITDELRLATNFRGKVIGVSIKDRGSILPAGHAANAAYWYDSKTGDFITSTYYMDDLPDWVKKFNGQKLVDKYYKEGWKTLYPLNSYLQSTSDVNNFEGRPFGKETTGFPYNFEKAVGKDYGVIATTPGGISLVKQFAETAVTSEQLGADDITDFLAVSFSSTDYVGHSFGPNSIEAEDIYLRLDKELGDLLTFLDTKVGKDQYTVFLSADHGAAHVPAFLKENKIPAGSVDFNRITVRLNEILKEKFGVANLVSEIMNYQVSFNLPAIDKARLSIDSMKQTTIPFLDKIEGIARVLDMNDISTAPINAKIREMLANGFFPQRSGQIQLIMQPQWIEGFSAGGTTHGVWHPYDAHIPLLWYGRGIKQGGLKREVCMSDIAPTLAALLRIQMPNGCVGKVIEEVLR